MIYNLLPPEETMRFTAFIVVPFAVLVLILISNTGNAQHPRDSMFGNYRTEIDPCSPCGEVFCNPCDAVECDSIFGHQRHGKKKSLGDSINTYGWLQAGVLANSHGHRNIYNTGTLGPATRNLDPLSGNAYITGTTQPADFMINQLWLGMEKQLDTQHGWDWGFRTDFFFGTDARFTQCFGDKSFDYNWGNGEYYDSFVQLYAELGYKNLKFRVGKFATIMIHETLPGPLSFFYSHAYSYYSVPMTYTGAIAEYKIDDQWTVLGGWVSGAHNSFENRFGDETFLGQVQYRPNNDMAVTYSLYYGGYGGLNRRADALDYSRAYNTETETLMTLRYAWQMNRRWFYMVEGIWGQNDDKGVPSIGDHLRKTYGINQHLTYTINKEWSIGTRFEWLHGKGTFVDLAPLTGGQGTDIYDLTVAANWNFTENIIVRPEIRYDWTSYKNGFKPFGGGNDKDQLSGGFAIIVIF